MSHISEMYPLVLLSPAESLTLYFSLAQEVEVRDLVAAISCFDAEGNPIGELEPLAFSSSLARHYVYLGSRKTAGRKWEATVLSAALPIKRVEVEIIRWRKSFAYDIKDVVKGVWAGQVSPHNFRGSPLNFVSIRGVK